MLKLKLWYFGHLMWRTDSEEKTLMLRKSEGKKRRDDKRWDGWMASSTQWTWLWANSGRWWRTGNPGVLQSMGSQRVRYDWVTEQQQHKSTTTRREDAHVWPHTPDTWTNLCGWTCKHTVIPLKVHNLKVSMCGTYYVRILEKTEQPQIKSIQQIHKNQKEENSSITQK